MDNKNRGLLAIGAAIMMVSVMGIYALPGYAGKALGIIGILTAIFVMAKAAKNVGDIK